MYMYMAAYQASLPPTLGLPPRKMRLTNCQRIIKIARAIHRPDSPRGPPTPPPGTHTHMAHTRT